MGSLRTVMAKRKVNCDVTLLVDVCSYLINHTI